MATTPTPIMIYILGAVSGSGSLFFSLVFSRNLNSGLGKKLLEDVVAFSKQKKLVSVRLNTQTQNKHAQSLYLNNGFVYTKTNFLIPLRAVRRQ